MDDAADGGHSEVGFEVPMVIPHERGDAIAPAQAEALECRCQRTSPGVEICVGVPVRRVVGALRNDRGARKQAPGVVQQRRECKLEGHHDGFRSTAQPMADTNASADLA